MAREQPTTVYTEVQIDEDSISLTLISESGSSGAVIEDTERFTFEELEESLSGEHKTLRLSRESANALQYGAALEAINSRESGRIEVGDIVVDKNPPSWSEHNRLEVVEVLSDVRADEYVVQGRNEGEAVPVEEQDWTDETVRQANPEYPADDTVVLAKYMDEGSNKAYAFPASRLNRNA